MKIASINNGKSKSNVAFGYNQALNRKVVKALKSELSGYDQAMLKLNKLCNETEDKLNLQTKFTPRDEDGSYGEEVDNYIGFFIDLKVKLAEDINEKFPKLNFPRLEAKHYDLEVADDELSWKNELVDILNEVAEEQTFKIEMR